MFWDFASFELKRRLRMPSTYIYMAIFGGLALFLIMASAGLIDGVEVNSGSNKEWRNSPHMIHGLNSILGAFMAIIIAAISGRAIYQDFHNRVYQLFFTKPISKLSYLGGRFLGSQLVLLLICASIPMGLALGAYSPFVKPELIGPFNLTHYVMPFLTITLPNVFFLGAVFFSLATLTRKIFPVYIGAVVVLVGWLMATNMLSNLDNKMMAALIDPLGFIASDSITDYWTVEERNTLTIPLTGYFLANRLLWISVGLLSLFLTYTRFSFSVQKLGGKKGKADKVEAAASKAPKVHYEPVRPDFGGNYGFGIYKSLTMLELKETIKNVFFLVLTFCAVIFTWWTASESGALYGTETYPVTYKVLQFSGGTFILFILIITVFVAGELVWRERTHQMDQICDAMPIPTWTIFTSKLTALIAMQALLLFILMVNSMLFQLVNGYTKFEVGQYLMSLFVFGLPQYALWAVLAFAIHTVVNKKFFGHFLMILYYGFLIGLGTLNYDHGLYTFFNLPGVNYSDMNGYGYFTDKFYLYSLYWGAFALALSVFINLIWVRGKESGLKRRIFRARSEAELPSFLLAGLGLLLFVGTGGYIFYNHNILNTYTTLNERLQQRADFEKKYREQKTWSVPSVTDVKVEVDIFPYRRGMQAKGTYIFKNKTDEPISTVMISFVDGVETREFSIQNADLDTVDKEHNIHIYKFNAPLAPGESSKMTFEVAFERKGIPNRDNLVQLVENGTFFDNGHFFPHIGYPEGAELSDSKDRKDHDLPPKERMPDLDDHTGREHVYLGNIDRINFEAVVSTVEDQIAIAPGYLEKEWTENGRRYFHYKMAEPIWNFYSFLSARYEVKRDTWNGLPLEIYYHKGHEYNLQAMMDGLKASLEYCSTNFSPYQHKQARIIEFPGYRSFAQAFPNTIPFSEAIGFIARVEPDNEEDLDYPYYVTAHEIAHQWWAHQIAGSNNKGATMLSESLSQYTALMIMKERFGDKKMKRFLRYELRQYLMGRGTEREKELPIAENENQQYIHYNKGSIVFYALQDHIGEEAVNRALSRFLDEWAFKPAPYPTSMDLIKLIRQEAPEDKQQLITDLFETITIWDLRAKEASYTELENGTFEVTLKTHAEKKQTDEIGKETEMPLNESIELGVFDGDGELLYLEKHRFTEKEQEFKITVDKKPAKAGIDPLHKYVDRRGQDNLQNVKKL